MPPYRACKAGGGLNVLLQWQMFDLILGGFPRTTMDQGWPMWNLYQWFLRDLYLTGPILEDEMKD